MPRQRRKTTDQNTIAPSNSIKVKSRDERGTLGKASAKTTGSNVRSLRTVRKGRSKKRRVIIL